MSGPSEAPPSGRSLLVGIAGGSASGKTTITAALAKQLTGDRGSTTVEVIGMDRYFYRGAAPGPRIISPTTGESLPDNNHPNSADNERMVGEIDERRTALDRPNIIIIEGLMALHLPEVRERCDLRIFVELESDLRALRRLIRDMTGIRGNPDPHFISRYYRECARVGHNRYVEPSREYADIIIRGDSNLDRIVPMVESVIRNLQCVQLPQQVTPVRSSV